MDSQRFQPRPLIGITIRGAGTGRIEQLSSFSARLAEELCLPFVTLFRDAICPAEAVKESARGPMISSNVVIEAIGKTALTWTVALQRYAGVSGLHNCSMLPFQGAIAPRRLITLARRWCPLCLEEMADSKYVYEPLVWRLSEVRICPTHRVTPVEVCPHCEKGGQVSLVANARVGCCRYCGGWLGQNAVGEPAEIDEFTSYCAKACEDLLLVPQTLKEGEEILPSTVSVSGLRDVFFRGNGSEMARRIGELPSQLNAYCNGEFPAPLHVFLRASYVTGASMREIFVTQAFDETAKGRPEAEFHERRAKSREAYNQELVDTQLRAAISEGGRVSVRLFATRLNVEPVTLWRRSPALAKELARLHAKHVAQQSAERKSVFIEDARKVVDDLRASGIEPTPEDVKLRLQDPGVGLNPWKRAVVRELTIDPISNRREFVPDELNGGRNERR